MKQLLLFEEEETRPVGKSETRKGRREAWEDYEAFVRKFDKAAKTTDDCYTPPAIYEAVLGWLKGEVDLEGKEIMRPFYPGGDYKAEEYGGDCVVVDNPPFSIFSEIVTYYLAMGVKFFLFAPALTLTSASVSGRKDVDVTYITCGVDVTYANGAKVCTSFVSNLFGDVRLWCCHGLYKAVRDADKKQSGKKKAIMPKYAYPSNVTTAALLNKISKGADLKIMRDECHRVSRLQSQMRVGKSIFGNGFLLSDEAAERKEAAELASYKEAAIILEQEMVIRKRRENERAIKWELSGSEKRIIKQLGKNRV